MVAKKSGQELSSDIYPTTALPRAKPCPPEDRPERTRNSRLGLREDLFNTIWAQISAFAKRMYRVHENTYI